MKKKLLIILSIIVLLLIATYIFISYQEKKIKNLQSQITYLEDEFIPMAFEISSNSNSEIKLKTVFYNLDGEKVGSKNLKLNGDELHIDFKVIDFSDDNYLFFPYGMMTDKMAATDIIPIYDAYDHNDFPEIYEGITELKDENGNVADKTSKEKIEKDLKNKFMFIKTGQEDFSGDSHGVAIHDIKSISEYKKGFVYEIICHPHTGAIESVLK